MQEERLYSNKKHSPQWKFMWSTI